MVLAALSPALFAVLAGLFFALSSIYTRWGLERASIGAAVLVTALANVVVFWPLFLIFAPFGSISSWAVLAFIGAGATGPFLGRMLLFNGMARVGVSVATPLYNVQVLFAAIGGVVFFNETLTPFVGLGTLVLLGGVALLSERRPRTYNLINRLALRSSCLYEEMGCQRVLPVLYYRPDPRCGTSRLH